MFKVLYNFQKEEDGELSVKAGDVVQDYSMGKENPEGWILVKSKNNEIGYVPVDYLKEIEQPPSEKKSEKSDYSMNIKDLEKTPESKPETIQPIDPNIAKTWSFAQVEKPPEHNIENLMHQASKGLSRTSSKESLTSYTNEKSNFGKFSSSLSRGGASATGNRRLYTAAHAIKSMMNPINKMKVHGSTITGPKPPPITSIIENEDYDDLIQLTEKYFDKMINNQAEYFSSQSSTLEDFSVNIKDSINSSNELIVHLATLGEMIDEEKKHLKQNIDAERNAEVLHQTRNLVSPNPTTNASAGATRKPGMLSHVPNTKPINSLNVSTENPSEKPSSLVSASNSPMVKPTGHNTSSTNNHLSLSAPPTVSNNNNNQKLSPMQLAAQAIQKQKLAQLGK